MERRRLAHQVEDNLERNFKLDERARGASLSVSGQIRKSRVEFGCSPRAYVLRQRLERVRRLLSRPVADPLKCYATECGFPDQSHLGSMPHGIPHAFFNDSGQAAMALFRAQLAGKRVELYRRIHNVSSPAEVVPVACDYDVVSLPPVSLAA